LLLCPVAPPDPVGKDKAKEWGYIRSADNFSESVFLAFKLCQGLSMRKYFYFFGLDEKKSLLTMPETY
jgi:hypothetical protein